MVRAQRLRLATDLLWLGNNTGCTPNFPVSRTGVMRQALVPTACEGAAEGAPAARAADGPRRAHPKPSIHAGAAAATTSSVGAVAADIPASADAAAAASTDLVPLAAAARSTYNHDASNPDQCCNGDFPMSAQCCNVYCKWVAAYLGALVTVEECCVGILLTPLQWSC